MSNEQAPQQPAGPVQPAKQVKISDFFPKNVVRAGLVSGGILAAVILVASILPYSLDFVSQLLVVVGYIVAVAFGLVFAHAMQFKSDKLADALKLGVAFAVLAGLVAGVGAAIGGIVSASTLTSSLGEFGRYLGSAYQPNYFGILFESLLRGVLVMGATVLGGVVVGVFVPAASLPKEVTNVLDKVKGIVMGK